MLAFWLVLFGIPTLLLNRAIIPALPGSRSGLELVLDRAIAVGGVSSQLLALVITLLLIRLIVSSIGAAAIGTLERLFVLPIGSAVGFLVVAASVGPLDPELHLLLAGVSSVGLMICARPALRHPSTRAGGILLACIVGASICFATARLTALRASVEAIPRQYAVARWLATAGQLFDWLSLVWTMVWTARSARAPGVVRIAVALTITIAVTVCARLGQGPDSTFLLVVAARAFGALAREPSPYLSGLVGPASDLLALLLSLAVVTLRNPRNLIARRAMALLLLGRCSLDVPALAGITTAGGLLLAWFAPRCSPPAAPISKSSPPMETYSQPTSPPAETGIS